MARNITIGIVVFILFLVTGIFVGTEMYTASDIFWFIVVRMCIPYAIAKKCGDVIFEYGHQALVLEKKAEMEKEEQKKLEKDKELEELRKFKEEQEAASETVEE